MGWNGSGGAATPVKPKGKYPPSEASFAKQSGYRGAKKPSPVRGLVAGLVVVGLAAGAYFAFFSGAEKPQDEKTAEKERGLIKEVKPAAAPKAKEPEPPKVVKPRGPRTRDGKIHAPIGKDNVQKLPNGDMIVTDPDGSKTLVAVRHVEPPCQHITSNNFERLLMLYAIPGEDIPPVPTDSFTKEDVIEALTSKVEFKDDDWDETRIRKQGIEELKAIFRQELKEGKTAEEFVRELQARQANEAYTVQTAKEMIMKSLREDDVELSRELAKKLNDHLNQKGLPSLHLPRRYSRILYPEESQNNQPANPQN